MRNVHAQGASDFTEAKPVTKVNASAPASTGASSVELETEAVPSAVRKKVFCCMKPLIPMISRSAAARSTFPFVPDGRTEPRHNMHMC